MQSFKSKMGLLGSVLGRCRATKQLELHHKNRSAGNDLANAQVLCQHCHERTHSYGRPGKTPPSFPPEVRERAFKRADNRCECVEADCHD